MVNGSVKLTIYMSHPALTSTPKASPIPHPVLSHVLGPRGILGDQVRAPPLDHVLVMRPAHRQDDFRDLIASVGLDVEASDANLWGVENLRKR